MDITIHRRYPAGWFHGGIVDRWWHKPVMETWTHGGNMEYSLSVDDIVQQTGINTSTVRRYLREYSDFIPSTPINRKQSMYARETIDIVNRISELYTAGKYTRDIGELLKYEFSISVPVEGVVRLPEATSDETSVVVADEIRDLQQQINRVVMLAESLIEKTTQIEEHDAEIKTLRRDLVDTKAQVTGYVDQLISFERVVRDQNQDPRLAAVAAEVQQNALTIQQQNATIALLTEEITAIRQHQAESFIYKLRQTFGLR